MFKSYSYLYGFYEDITFHTKKHTISPPINKTKSELRKREFNYITVSKNS